MFGITCTMSVTTVTASATTNQRIGLMGSGAVIGTLVAGPVGTVLGVALGDWLNTHYLSSIDNADLAELSSHIESPLNKVADPFNKEGEVSIYFDTASYTLSSDDEILLEKVMDVMKSNPSFRLYIVGATDPRGNSKFNETLSNQRADIVKSYLTNHGNISEDHMLTKGIGAIDAAEKTDENYKKLRVTKLKLIDMRSNE